MKTILITLSLVLTIQSCKQESTSHTSTGSSHSNKIVLSAFNDMTTPSSFKEDALLGLPEVVNFSDKMTPAKNQGQRGTCTFFAATALVEAAISIDLGIKVNLSEEYMIYSTKNQGHYDDVEASHVSVNLQSLKTGGILLEKDWSYIPSFFEEGKPCYGLNAESDETAIDCFVHTPEAEALKKVIPATAIKTGFIRKNTNEIIKFLANNQRPLTISLPVNFSAWSSSGSVYYNEELRQQCLRKPSDCGAHAVLLTGYNLAEKVFYFKNSWGSDWGHNGFGEISFEMVDRYVDGYLYFAKVDGEIIVPQDHADDEVSIESLKTEAIDHKNVNVEIKIVNGSGRYIEVQHYLSFIYTDEYGDTSSAEPISIPSSERRAYDVTEYVIAATTLTDEQKAGQAIVYSQFSEKLLNVPIVQGVLQEPSMRLMIITGYFLQTDMAEAPILLHQTLTPVNEI